MCVKPIACMMYSLLYLQVSQLLTNHLSRAMDRLVVSESGASEGLQDALSLLLGLAKSHMGRAILSQPACVSKLLLLLTDQRYGQTFARTNQHSYICCVTHSF